MKPNYQINNQVNNLMAWQNNKFSPPVIINIRLTEKCNLKCKFCWRRSKERLQQGNYGNPLSEERILNIRINEKI